MSLRIGLQRLLVDSNKSGMNKIQFFQRRCESAVSGPPLKPLSDLECLVIGGGMCFAIMYLPIHSIMHLREYGGRT